MSTQCGYCNTESPSNHPSGWYVLLGSGEHRKEFCTRECLTAYHTQHANEIDPNTQVVRWK